MFFFMDFVESLKRRVKKKWSDNFIEIINDKSDFAKR